MPRSERVLRVGRKPLGAPWGGPVTAPPPASPHRTRESGEAPSQGREGAFRRPAGVGFRSRSGRPSPALEEAVAALAAHGSTTGPEARGPAPGVRATASPPDPGEARGGP